MKKPEDKHIFYAEEWSRLNTKYDDNITKAHKMLKDMYGYNYNLEFDDEVDLKGNDEYNRIDESARAFELDYKSY